MFAGATAFFGLVGSLGHYNPLGVKLIGDYICYGRARQKVG
jgi:hypothetical protein